MDNQRPSQGGKYGENSLQYLTYKQAAALLQVSERTLWTWVNDGQVPHAKFGKTVRFSRAALEQWFEQQLHGGGWPGTDDEAGSADDDEAGEAA